MTDWDDEDQVERREQTPRTGGLRHDVAIPAHIELIAGDDIQCEIVDVSSTGMYLRLVMFLEQGDPRTLPSGGAVTVAFVPDAENGAGTKVRVRGEIVRRDPHGIGLRFGNLDKDQTRALRMVAVRAVESRASRARSSADTKVAAASKIDARQVCSACLKVLERRLASLLWTLRTEVTTRLRNRRQSDADSAEGSARADAELIDEKGTAIARTAERRVIQAFARLADLDSTEQIVLAHLKRKPAAPAVSTGQKIGLVGDKAVQSSVLLEDACQRLETALSSRSFGVNVRLANVLRRRIDGEESNPLLPDVMCRMLWQSVTEYCDTPRVHNCLRAAIVHEITPLLSELYEQLDQTLDTFGVPESYWMSDGEGPGSRK